MEILTLCGSPRFGRGAKECSSLYLIQQLKTRLGQGARLQTEPANPPRDLEALARALTGAQALVLAFPLYADSIPAGLLQTLSELERRLTGGSELDKIPVYSIVNCGFFEAAHNQPAIDMIEIWRKKCGFQPGRSLAVGGGEMIRQPPMCRWTPWPRISWRAKAAKLCGLSRIFPAFFISWPATWAFANKPGKMASAAGTFHLEILIGLICGQKHKKARFSKPRLFWLWAISPVFR